MKSTEEKSKCQNGTANFGPTGPIDQRVDHLQKWSRISWSDQTEKDLSSRCIASINKVVRKEIVRPKAFVHRHGNNCRLKFSVINFQIGELCGFNLINSYLDGKNNWIRSYRQGRYI